MLNNQPRGFRSVLADCLLIRPAAFVDNFLKPFCVLGVHGFHSGNVAVSQLTGFHQFLPNSQVFGAHCD
jgi:hypothetical protein